MGNLLSVLIGCVGAIEMFTLLHQITTRAELEYERLRLSEISESSPQDGAEILQRIISSSQSGQKGTLSSDVTESTLSEENEDEVTYPWGDINPEHHKGFRHQMEKSLSIGDLKEEDEKLASSVESNTDWRKNAEIATKTAERERSADVTVSSAEWKNPGDFEAVPGSFACIDQTSEIPEVEDEAKVEEWLNHGRLRDSFSPSGTLTRSKRCLQMESMDVQDGDSTSEATTDITSEEIVAEIVEMSLDTNHTDDSYSYLELTIEDKEEILGVVSHKSPSPISPRNISQEFLEHEKADEVEDEELVLSGEEEIEDFDDIVNALKKNVAKEDIKFEDLLEDASLTSQKNDIFSVSPEREEDDGTSDNKSETDEEECLTFPEKIRAARDEFPLEDMIPYSEVSGEEKPRCEILEQVKMENRRRRQMEGPDKYFAPRPSIIDFPTKLQMSNAKLQDDLKVFPLKNVNDSKSFPTNIVPVREKSSEIKSDTKPEIVVTQLPAAEKAEPRKFDELAKFINNERLSISPGRQSYERSHSNMRIADRDDPLMELLKDRMFPY